MASRIPSLLHLQLFCYFKDCYGVLVTGFTCQMPVNIPYRALCATAWLNVAQCHLVKFIQRYFYKLPKCKLLANSKCASMKKLYEAAGA